MRIRLFILIFLAVNSVYSQDSISITALNLPNSHYKVHSKTFQSTIVKVYDENDPQKKTIFYDDHYDTIINVNHIYNGALTDQNWIPFVFTYDTLEMKDPTTGKYFENSEDLAVHGFNKNNYYSIDSVSSSAMNSVWKFRMKRGMQNFYDQSRIPSFQMAIGDTAEITKSINNVGGPSAPSMAIKYRYIFTDIRDGIAFFTIETVAELGDYKGEFESFNITGTGEFQYHIEHRNIEYLEIEANAEGKKIKGSEIGVFINSTIVKMHSEYLGNNLR